MTKRRDELSDLVKQWRIRTQLLTAQTVQREVRLAAARVVRLSQPGTPERLLTLLAVQDDTGVPSSEIVKEILRAKRKQDKPDGR